MLYLPSFYSWVKGEHINTDIIKYGTIEDCVNTDAYLIRNEEQIRAPFTGKCVLNYSEGTKVPVGAKIITIYKENVDSTIEKISELQKKILSAQREKMQNDMIFVNDIKKIDEQIGRSVKELVQMSISGNISDASKVRKSIDSSIKKKASITGPLSTSDMYIQSLQKQLEDCEQILESKKQDIVSNSSGVMSYIIDSDEGYFNEDAIYRITSKDLERLSSSNKIFKDGEVIDGNKVFAKVVNNVEAYVIVVFDDKNKFTLNIDDFVSIRVNELDNLKINGEVYYISEEQDTGKILVAIKINKGIDETVGIRKTNIDLVTKEFNGLKVHLSALTNFDDEKGEADIFTVAYNCALRKRVKVLYHNSIFAIIDATDDKDSNSIGAYEEYIINAQDGREGMIVRK